MRELPGFGMQILPIQVAAAELAHVQDESQYLDKFMELSSQYELTEKEIEDILLANKREE